MTWPDETTTAAEPNYYLAALRTAVDTTLPDARERTCGFTGLPTDAAAESVAGGGWDAPQGRVFVDDLTVTGQAIADAFDSAIAAVDEAILDEPETVPAGDWRGERWHDG